MLNKKNLLIAVLCSLIAACLAYSYLEELEARVMSSNDTGNVVVAVVDIPEGTCITSDMIEERQISVDLIAMRASRRLQDVVGKSAIEGITKGEQIIETRLGSGREIKSFVNTISGGLRAVTLNVSEDCTFSGLLRPGTGWILLAAQMNMAVESGMCIHIFVMWRCWLLEMNTIHIQIQVRIRGGICCPSFSQLPKLVPLPWL